jgi:hypothetical protein
MSYFDDIYHIESALNCFIRNNPADQSDFSLYAYKLWKHFSKSKLQSHELGSHYKDSELDDVVLFNVLTFQCQIDNYFCDQFDPEIIVPLLKADPAMKDYCHRLAFPQKHDETYGISGIHNINFLKSALLLASDAKENAEDHIDHSYSKLSDHIANLAFEKLKNRSPFEDEINQKLSNLRTTAEKFHDYFFELSNILQQKWDLNTFTKCIYANYFDNNQLKYWLLVYAIEIEGLNMTFKCSVDHTEPFNYQLYDIDYDCKDASHRNIVDFYINNTSSQLLSTQHRS